MSKLARRRIVVKVGTKVLTDAQGILDPAALTRITTQLAQLKKAGHEVALVSSGAMGAGKSMLKTSKALSAMSEKQLFAAIGQARLMAEYSRRLARRSLLCAQVLATKEDFRDRSHYFNMRHCLEALLLDGVIPVINENDAVALDELAFTDNDELAGLVASMLGADLLLILSAVDGVLDADGRVIPEIVGDQTEHYQTAVTADRSEAGRGGMTTKFEVARRAARQGIEVIIANGLADGIMLAASRGKATGTRFVPGRRQNNTRRRLAHSDSLVGGRVRVNSCAEAVLRADGASSLLLVGVTGVEGDFAKGDVIEVINEHDRRLGYGISQYPAAAAREAMGRHGERPLIHYDRLFIE